MKLKLKLTSAQFHLMLKLAILNIQIEKTREDLKSQQQYRNELQEKLDLLNKKIRTKQQRRKK